jgi:hypothetical protein
LGENYQGARQVTNPFTEIMRGYTAAQLEFLRKQELGRAVPANDDPSNRSVVMTDSNQLPVVPDDGFEDDDSYASNRIIQGSLLKCTDGRWINGDGNAPADDARYLVLGVSLALQRWENKRAVDVIIKTANAPLPEAESLNATIPQKEWELDLNGGPKPPWQKTYVVYLVDVNDASVYTYANSTKGAQIAYERLHDRVKWMSRLRGKQVRPIVKLANRVVSKKYGKLGPEFTVMDWRDLAGDLQAQKAPQQIEHKNEEPGADPVEQVGHPVDPATWEEILDDEIPAFDEKPKKSKKLA